MFNKKSELATAIANKRADIVAKAQQFQEREAAACKELAVIRGMPYGREELITAMESVVAELRQQALRKLKRYFIKVVAKAPFDDMPRLIAQHCLNPQWLCSEFPVELLLTFIDIPKTVDEIMQCTDPANGYISTLLLSEWVDPPLNQAARAQRMAELNQERETVYNERENLRMECEQLGMVWPG